MEKQLDVVLPRHPQAVFDHHSSRRLVERDAALVHDRIGQAQVAVLPTLEPVALGRTRPEAAAGPRFLQPHEVAPRLRLVQSIHAQGVVRGRSAKVLPPWALRVVGIGSRIDEELLSPDRQSERQGVGVTMGRDRLITEGARIGNQPDLVLGLEVATEDVIAALWKRPPDRKLRPVDIELLKRRVRALPEKPARLVVQPTRFRLKITTAK